MVCSWLTTYKMNHHWHCLTLSFFVNYYWSIWGGAKSRKHWFIVIYSHGRLEYWLPAPEYTITPYGELPFSGKSGTRTMYSTQTKHPKNIQTRRKAVYQLTFTVWRFKLQLLEDNNFARTSCFLVCNLQVKDYKPRGQTDWIIQYNIIELTGHVCLHFSFSFRVISVRSLCISLLEICTSFASS